MDSFVGKYFKSEQYSGVVLEEVEPHLFKVQFFNMPRKTSKAIVTVSVTSLMNFEWFDDERSWRIACRGKFDDQPTDLGVEFER